MVIAFGVVLLLAILISGIAHRTVLSTAVLFLSAVAIIVFDLLFLIAGFLLGEGMLGRRRSRSD